MSQKQDATESLRMVFMGSPRVGKSSLISMFLYRGLTSPGKPSVSDLHIWEARTKAGKLFRVNMLDSRGSRDFPDKFKLSISSEQIFVLVHSLDDPESFEEVLKLLDKINQERFEGPSAPAVFVVGNKSDQRSADTMSIAMAELLLMDYMDVVRYKEVDSRRAESVNEVFSEIFDVVLGSDLRREGSLNNSASVSFFTKWRSIRRR